METFEVGGQEFQLVKTGRDQAEQVVQIGQWLSLYGLAALQELADEEGNIQIDNGVEMIGTILGQLTADALIDLFSLIIGCPKSFAEKHFDIAILIDAVMFVYESQSSFQRVISRFFSQTTSTNDSEESSMKSELPMDGMTTESLIT